MQSPRWKRNDARPDLNVVWGLGARCTTAIVTVMRGGERLGRFGDGDRREYRCETLGDRVIATMPVYLAMRTFFFDVGDFSTGR